MRILHTMIRVGNFEKSIAFYRDVLGMTVFSKADFPQGRFSLAFLGYLDGLQGATIELTHNWDVSSYVIGNGFGHIAIEVEDATAACSLIRAKGGKIVREAGPMSHGSTVIAFAEDLDGYRIELIQSIQSRRV